MQQLNSGAPKASSLDLFFLFLRIGAIGFGGHAALVAVIERELCEKKKLVRSQLIVDGVALASALPGPLAVNTVAYIGYMLCGTLGALASIAGVILPSFFLMIALAIFYGRFGSLPVIEAAFSGFMPAVIAVMVSVAWRLGRQNIKVPEQLGIAVLSTIVFLLLANFWTGIALIVAAAIYGTLRFARPGKKVDETHDHYARAHSIVPVVLLAVGVAVVTVATHFVSDPADQRSLSQLWSSFSGMSLVMFGGGYVFIPMMKQVVVDHYSWLSPREFADAIALGQVTPGPIMIAATFIGFRIAGLAGAAVATIGIFLPPALLTAFCSNLTQRIAKSPIVQAAYAGIRPCVIGMILTAAIVLARSAHWEVIPILIFLGSLALTIRYKVDTLYIIPGAGFVGMIGYFLG